MPANCDQSSACAEPVRVSPNLWQRVREQPYPYEPSVSLRNDIFLRQDRKRHFFCGRTGSISVGVRFGVPTEPREASSVRCSYRTTVPKRYRKASLGFRKRKIVFQPCFTTRNLRTKLCGIRSQTEEQEFVDPFKSWYLETLSDPEMENRLASPGPRLGEGLNWQVLYCVTWNTFLRFLIRMKNDEKNCRRGASGPVFCNLLQDPKCLEFLLYYGFSNPRFSP